MAEDVHPFLESKLKQILRAVDCEIYDRSTGHLPWAGSLTAGALARGAEEITGERFRSPRLPSSPMMTRTSLFDLEPCAEEFDAGCPHLATFTALRSGVARAGVPVTVTGDVGCMSLDIKMGDPVIETMTCMGASPSVAAGIKIAMPERRVVAVIGDSSFFHSGIQGVLNNIQQGVRVITLILDNMITAQSGFQPDAGTRRALSRSSKQRKSGESEATTMMDELLRTIGSRVMTIDSFSPDLERVFAQALLEDKSLVIISRGRCPIAERVGAYAPTTSI